MTYYFSHVGYAGYLIVVLAMGGVGIVATLFRCEFRGFLAFNLYGFA